ncbi:MAG: hypothetical protein V4654_08950 [Bdellovibrionota bacterium]
MRKKIMTLVVLSLLTTTVSFAETHKGGSVGSNAITQKSLDNYEITNIGIGSKFTLLRHLYFLPNEHVVTLYNKNQNVGDDVYISCALRIKKSASYIHYIPKNTVLTVSKIGSWGSSTVVLELNGIENVSLLLCYKAKGLPTDGIDGTTPKVGEVKEALDGKMVLEIASPFPMR